MPNLKASDLTIIPQTICNERYNLTEDDDLYKKVQTDFPNLIQDDLLCAAHDVRIVIIG